MKSTKLSKLMIVVAAASMMAGAAAPTPSFALAVEEVFQQVGSYVQSNDIASALALIDRLRALGITELEFDGQRVSLEELRGLVTDGSTPRAQAAIQRLAEMAAEAASTSFLSEGRVISSARVTQELQDIFPTGSAG